MIFTKSRTMTLLIFIGLLIGYVHQMAPAPLLLILKNHFGITHNDALLNLSISIIYPPIILASILGGFLKEKIGTSKLYICTLFFMSLGMIFNFFATNYILFLIGRVILGLGFGFGIPFMGSAIMEWYTPKQREVMNTMNGLFPYLGTLISFGLLLPMYNLFDNSWKLALGIWGIIGLVVAMLWIGFMNKELNKKINNSYTEPAHEKNIYQSLWKQKEIKLLSITFICDYICYSYVVVVLPTLLIEANGMSETDAGLWSAISFSIVGILGGILGGIAMKTTGKRRFIIIWGQILKFIGLVIVSLSAGHSTTLLILGFSLFGFGDGFWLPALYTIPTELEDMTPAKVGAAFSVISTCGFICGFIAPVVGGYLTDQFMLFANTGDSQINHVFGLKWSIFTFALCNVFSFISALSIRETGPSILCKKN